jgi:hypothetical protein
MAVAAAFSRSYRYKALPLLEVAVLFALVAFWLVRLRAADGIWENRREWS